VYIIFLLAGLSIIGKVVYVQFVEGEIWRSEAEQMSQRKRTIPANRGDILAEDLQPLASSLPKFTVAIDPNSTGMSDSVFNADVSGLAGGLSRLFTDHSADYYLRSIRTAKSQGSRYLILKKEVSYEEMKEVRKLPLFKYGQFKGGLIFTQENVRTKPFRLLANRTIGYTREGDEAKMVGIEGAFNDYLAGQDGFRYEHRLGGGSWIPLSTDNETDPIDGRDVVTTLNINYQDVAEEALHQLLVEHQAHHGCVILMEVATGEIKAMANLGRYSDGEYYEDLNYAISERTEPGSTFKLASMMALLEDGFVKLDDTINTFNGKYKMYDQTIEDAHDGGFGNLTVAEVFEKSSNIGMARLVDRYYKSQPRHFVDRLYALGLKNRADIQIEGEPDPLIKYPDDPSWSLVTLMYMAHGYELEMTPLQVLAFYNTIANNGRYVKPRLVKELRQNSLVIKEFGREVLRNTICSDETLEQVKGLLEGVVERGTAVNLQSDQYRLAGKTGTAVVAHNDKGYVASDGKKEYRASFVGYFPADNPKYSGIVVITRPNMGVYYGNKVAGKVFRDIADRVYSTDLVLHQKLEAVKKNEISEIPFVMPGYWLSVKTLLKDLNLPFSENGQLGSVVTTLETADEIVVEDLVVKYLVVPDVTGMGLKDALPMLENAGMKVNVEGYGRIRNQSIDPGSEVLQGSIIELNLEAGI